MYIKKTEEELDCGIRVAFKIFGGKWKLCIIDAINRGITRPADIHKSIINATPRVIEIQLAELLFFGVIEKWTADTYPKRSEYKLTPCGETILPLLSQIDKWGTRYSAFVRERQNELQAAG
jgi:DNA-binding HxlR family transcriptional regulator